DGTYCVVSNRWQMLTGIRVNETTLEMLAEECDEFLIHAADVEGKKSGIETELAAILGQFSLKSGFPVVYAGGVHTMEDLDLIAGMSGAGIDVTVGSALDLFGGSLPLDALRKRAEQLSGQFSQ
ncbi:MAG: phosphoribosylformimino-5-aminoimidazole carboxamide ribotide isomerase, partial [Butyrivibrio sp.]|nr:phosphoribosylformimino-5-aminoimidazole carboxamide ribotide isomerase [Butyrivibrio sp.]